MRGMLLGFAAVVLAGDLAAQTQPQQSDAVDAMLRSEIDNIATAAGFEPLRNRSLATSVQRELIAYIGFGLGYPQHVTRIWEEADGVSGWHGFWSHALRFQPSPIRSTVRTVAERYGCTEFRQRNDYEVCTLPAPRVPWGSVLKQLDSLGVAGLTRSSDRAGADGTALVLEYRDQNGYRAFWYWLPREEAEDVNERVAAEVMKLIGRLPTPINER